MKRPISTANVTLKFPGLNQLLILGNALFGLVGLGLSARISWFAVPVASQGSAAGLPHIEAIEPWVTYFYQGGAFITMLLLAVSWLWSREWNLASVSIACVWLIVVFAYPYLVMVHDPPIAAQATWLHTQHNNLIWLGGDINTSHEFSTHAWKDHVYVVDAPQQVAVIKLPSWSPLEIGLDRLSHLVEWLGYSNVFCQFVGKGWLLAFMGGGAMLLSTFFHQGHADYNRAGYAIGLLSILGAIFCVLAWSIPFLASQSLSKAGQHTVHGRYDLALGELDRVANQLPVLQEDTYYVAQRALLEHQLGHDTLFAKLHHATLLEREALYQQSLNGYREVISHAPIGSALRREASRALLRFAVHSMNSGDNTQAVEQLEELLALEPCNLKAIYMLQIAYLRCGKTRELYDLVDHLYETCSYLQFPTKRILLATVQQHATYAAMLDDDIDETWARWTKMRRP